MPYTGGARRSLPDTGPRRDGGAATCCVTAGDEEVCRGGGQPRPGRRRSAPGAATAPRATLVTVLALVGGTERRASPADLSPAVRPGRLQLRNVETGCVFCPARSGPARLSARRAGAGAGAGGSVACVRAVPADAAPMLSASLGGGRHIAISRAGGPDTRDRPGAPARHVGVLHASRAAPPAAGEQRAAPGRLN